jgi:hypothetical protein
VRPSSRCDLHGRDVAQETDDGRSVCEEKGELVGRERGKRQTYVSRKRWMTPRWMRMKPSR